MHHPHPFGSNLANSSEPQQPSGQYLNPAADAYNFDTFEDSDKFSPKGNVAALRNVIHGQLDMKTPTGNSSRYQKPAPPPVDSTPSWAKNVKVYEPNGYVDPHLNKHNMGRVLDGPVNPNKYFQGVPPASYSQVKHNESKPPVPPSTKPPHSAAQALQAQVLQSSKAPSQPQQSQKTSYRIPYDVALDPRHHLGEFDIDDSASIISSCISTFGESSEIAGFSAAAEQRHLYEQYRKKLMEEKNELKEGSETPCVSLSEKVMTSSTENLKNGNNQQNQQPEPQPPSSSIFNSELTPFGHVAPVAKQFEPTNFPPFSPEKESEIKRSIDLESSQLLVKSKSPAPYSTSSTDHYGTIRRKHKPVAIDLSKSSPNLASQSPSNLFFGASFEEKQNRSPMTSTPSYKEQGFKNDSLNDSLNQAFEIASSIETTKNAYEAPPTPKSASHDRSISDTYPVSSSTTSTWPSHTTTPTTTTAAAPIAAVAPQTYTEQQPMSTSMSSSVMSTNMDEPIVVGSHQQIPQQSPDSSPERNEDMSQWYRKMFKQMHRKGEDGSNEGKEQHFINPSNVTDGIGRTTPTASNLGRSRENLSFNQHRPDHPSSYFDSLEHGPNDQYNNQERVKQSNEEELLRLKAEKLAEELRKEKERKHSFIPSSAPSLQNNMDRLNSLLYDFSSDIQEPAHRDYTPQPVMTATAVYKFEPRSARELPLNRGDIIRIIREVDGYWMEGERNGRSGIFPTSYVQINTGNQGDSQKMRAIYPFTARSDTELSLKRGEIITRRRQIDSNWLEGSNQIGIVGIFPASYVEPIEQVEQHIPTIVPNRPKTPKIEDQVYNQVYKPNETVIMQSNQGYYDKAAVVPNNKVRFDLPSGSDSNLQMSLNPHQNQFPPTHTQTSTQQPSNYGMKKIEYEREKVVEEVPPMHMDQYRKLNDEPKNPKKDTNILMNAASLIPKGSEMYRAVYPYQPQKEDELQLYTNDIIFVVEKCDDGWFIGTSLRTGDFGIFPGNYVKRH